MYLFYVLMFFSWGVPSSERVMGARATITAVAEVKVYNRASQRCPAQSGQLVVGGRRGDFFEKIVVIRAEEQPAACLEMSGGRLKAVGWVEPQ